MALPDVQTMNDFELRFPGSSLARQLERGSCFK